MAYARRVVIARLVGLTAGFAMALACSKDGSEQQGLTELTVSDTLTANDSARVDSMINSVAREGWHDAPCDSCSAPGEVQIRAISKTTDIKAHNGPANLRVVAVIRNTSNEDVKHGPSHFVFKAHGVYLLFVSRRPDPDSVAVWGFTRFKIGSVLSPIDSLEECEHQTNPSRKDDANFYNCGDAHAQARGVSLVKSAQAASRPVTTATIPRRGWISCDPDCCTGAGTYTGAEQ